jgi:hypothetical protein
MEVHLHFPLRLHDMVFNQTQGQLNHHTFILRSCAWLSLLQTLRLERSWDVLSFSGLPNLAPFYSNITQSDSLERPELVIKIIHYFTNETELGNTGPVPVCRFAPLPSFHDPSGHAGCMERRDGLCLQARNPRSRIFCNPAISSYTELCTPQVSLHSVIYYAISD